MKKKIMLITWLGGGNFGTSLQSFALTKKLNTMGYNCYFLNTFSFDKSAFNIIKNFCRYFHIVHIIKFILSFKSKKARKIYMFHKENYRQVYISTRSQYNRVLETTDVFLAGSDQIWNTHHNYNPFFFLYFAKNKKKIAYASSIGTSHIPVKYEILVKDHLLNFQHIGVREETAAVVLNNLTERRDIVQVLDPTFLLSYNDWQDLAATAKIEIDLPEKYILCYCVGARDNYQSQLNEIKERLNNHNVIHIPSTENPNFIP